MSLNSSSRAITYMLSFLDLISSYANVLRYIPNYQRWLLVHWSIGVFVSCITLDKR